jgi:hypothetical protein
MHMRCLGALNMYSLYSCCGGAAAGAAGARAGRRRSMGQCLGSSLTYFNSRTYLPQAACGCREWLRCRCCRCCRQAWRRARREGVAGIAGGAHVARRGGECCERDRSVGGVGRRRCACQALGLVAYSPSGPRSLRPHTQALGLVAYSPSAPSSLLLAKLCLYHSVCDSVCLRVSGTWPLS